MKIFHLAVVAALVAVIAACGGGPVKRVSPPTASVQELVVQPDGQWTLTLRVQNFSSVPMTFATLDAKLQITGREVAAVSAALSIEIPRESAEIFTIVITPAPGSTLSAAHDFAYTLAGTISTSEPKRSFPFERTSRLSPVPGLTNTWR